MANVRVSSWVLLSNDLDIVIERFEKAGVKIREKWNRERKLRSGFFLREWAVAVDQAELTEKLDVHYEANEDKSNVTTTPYEKIQ